MTPVFIVLGAWVVFGGTHMVLSSTEMRRVIVRQVGEQRFVLIYASVALLGLVGLFTATWIYGAEGRAGFGLGDNAFARLSLGAVAGFGAVLLLAGLQVYFKSPMVMLRLSRRRGQVEKTAVLRPPVGVERITRHPFFIGIALLTGAHVLLVGTLATAVYFAGFVVLALAGAVLQDRRLRAQFGALYSAYQSETQIWPRFAALRELVKYPGAVLGAGVLLGLHPVFKTGNGALLILIVIGFGVFAVLRVMLKGRAKA